MEILGLSALATVVLSGLVAGTVELIKNAFDRNWRAVAIILGAGIVGGLAGLAFGVNFLVGAVYGLATSGYITIAEHFNKREEL